MGCPLGKRFLSKILDLCGVVFIRLVLFQKAERFPAPGSSRSEHGGRAAVHVDACRSQFELHHGSRGDVSLLIAVSSVKDGLLCAGAAKDVARSLRVR